MIDSGKGEHTMTEIRVPKHYPMESEALQFLNESLTKTFAIIDRYIHYFDITKKAGLARPFEYNERTTLSLLAGGIWQSSATNMVLEEYETWKPCDAGLYGGRGDIWFVANNLNCYGEAKAKDTNLAKFSATEADRFIRLLINEQCVAENVAAAEALEYEKTDNVVGYDRVLGILFIVPYLHKSYVDKAEQMLQKYYRTMENRLKKLENGYHVVWGKYYNPRLLQENAFNTPRDNANTNLDILVCAKQSSAGKL